jgi:hypothetical protein
VDKNIEPALEDQLIDLMAEPDIDDEARTSIWKLVHYLIARKVEEDSKA